MGFSGGSAVTVDNVTIDTNTDGAIRIKASGVDSSQLKSSSVTTDKLGLGSVSMAKLNDNVNSILAQNQIEIIELEASASLSPIDLSGSFVSDVMSDSTGYINTVQLGTSTATFSSNKYQRNNSFGSSVNATGVSLSGTDSNAERDGVTFKPSADYTLTKVTKSATCTALEVRLTQSDGTLIETVAFIGNDATFNRVLSSGVTYGFLLGSAGVPYTRHKGNASSVPVITANGQFTNGIYRGSDSGAYSDYGVSINNIVSITFTTSGTEPSKIIDCSLGTITGTVLYSYLFVKGNTETGSSITYKLKNATQSDDNLAVSTRNAVVNLSSVPTGIEIQLNPKSGSPTSGNPYLNTYCLVLVKA